MNAREDAVRVADTITKLQAEVARLQAEVELWKDRYEAAVQAAQQMEQHFDQMWQEGGR